MKVNVYTRNHGGTIPQKLVFSGSLNCVPRAGERVIPPGGSAALEVREVIYDLQDSRAYVYLDPDYYNEFKALESV